jgi:hypothetical protein
MITVTAGGNIKNKSMGPTRATMFETRVARLFEQTFTSGWLDGSWTDDDGNVVDELSLVHVGVTTLPREILEYCLSLLAEQFEQDALGLMVAHGGGMNSLIRPSLPLMGDPAEFF